MRFLLKELSRPRTVLFILGLVIAVNGFLYYRNNYPVTSSGPEDAAQEGVQAPDTTQEGGSATPHTAEADYIARVGDIQNGAVEAFAESNDKMLHYDAISNDDVQDMWANYLAIEDYSSQAANLDPPEGHAGQYELFRVAIADLYNAAAIAYRVSSNAVSATPSDFAEYERSVDEATTSLKRSNEILDQNYKTTEELPLPTRLI